MDKRCLILALFLVFPPLVSSCKEAGKGAGAGDDKGIKELKASGEELKATTEDLLKRRGTLQRSYAELEEARKALEQKRASLDKDDIDGHAKLAKEELALKEQESKLKGQSDAIDDKLMGALRRQEQFYIKAAAALATRGSGGSDDPTSGVRGRELAIAQREKLVAAREQDVAKREAALNEQHRKLVEYKAQKCAVATPVFTTISAPSVPTSIPGGKEYTKADADAALAKAMAVMSSKGIRVSDLPEGFAKLISDIRGFIGGKEYARAKFAADQLRVTLTGIKIDRAFVGAKMSRLASMIRNKKLTEDKKKEVNALFVKVTTAYNDGRFANANANINRIYGLLK
ncbi:MAG: hypothetical protein RBU30_10120 [Polyangia bacterium]|jgi:hypothetical protein|nr:hypothetical protein [Polyangia bacterium]